MKVFYPRAGQVVSLFVVTESNPYWLLTSPAPASVHRTRCGRVSINNQSVARCSALNPGQGQTGADLEQILRNPPSTCLSVCQCNSNVI